MEEAFERTARAAGALIAAIFAYTADRALFLSNRTPHARARSRQMRRTLGRHLEKLENCLVDEDVGDQQQMAVDPVEPGK